MDQKVFKRKFRNLILLAWNLPPVVGISFIIFIGVLSPEQMLTVLTTPFEPLYIIGWIIFSIWYFPRLVRPIESVITQNCESKNQTLAALKVLQIFPFHFWALFLVYLLIAPATVILSAEYFTDYVATPVDWFRIELISIIVSIIVGLPIFFLIYDLFGKALSSIEYDRPYITIKAKVFLIGALIPLLIDTMLVQYYWTRTGFFSIETFFVWLSFELLAVVGSLIFVKSFGQSLSPLQQLTSKEISLEKISVSDMRSMSTDELGLLTQQYRKLFEELDVHNKVLNFNNQILRSTVNTNNLPETVNAILPICQEAIKDDIVFLLLFDQKENELVGVAQSDADFLAEGYYRLPLNETSLANWVFKNDETCMVLDCNSDIRTNLKMREKFRVQSAIATPLRAEGKNIGVLMSIAQSRRQSYSKKEIALIEGVARDIAMVIYTQHLNDERIQSKRMVRETEQRFESIAQISPVGIFRTNLEGDCIDVNEPWLKMAGMSLDQVQGKGWVKALHAEDLDWVLEKWYRAVSEKKPFRTECRFQKPNGKVIWVLARAVEEHDADGNTVGFVGTITDITERMQMENAIRQIAAGIASKTADVFFEQLVYHLCQLFSARYAFISVLDEDDQGRTLAFCANGRKQENFAHKIKGTPCNEAMLTKENFFVEHVQQKYPNNEMLAKMNIESYIGIPMLNANREVIGSIAVMDDKVLDHGARNIEILEIFASRAAAEIERIYAENEVKRHRDHLEEIVEERTKELKEANRELETFSYTVSHDLRSPLRAIDGFSEVLLNDYTDKLDEDGRFYFQRIRGAAGKMAELIDDLLDLSRIGRTKINIQDVDLGRLASNIAATLESSQPERNVEWVVLAVNEVRGDERLLYIVMQNLLENAWKYSANNPAARIEFGSKNENGKIVYYVSDNGAGFDMAFASKIFGAFQRLHHVSEYEGTGIGLATVQRIIHLHGGQIWVEAEVGKGATFYFTLNITE